jgi:hypothetical protein
MPEGLDEGVLHRFFGVFDIPENSECHAKNATLAPSHERLEGPPVASQHTIHKEEIILARNCPVWSLGSLHCQNMRQVLRSKRFNECSEF